MIINNYMNTTTDNQIKSARRESATEKTNDSFSKALSSKMNDCPYGYLAKDGAIEYNGVVFACDPKTNSICLGDVSDPKKVLNVSLPSGGHLKMNINNFGDIPRAAGMFSPEDLNAIMRAIHQYNHCSRKLNEIDENEDEVMELNENQPENDL